MKLIYLLALVVMSTVANVVSEVIPKCSIWHMMGRIPDETDCTRYYQCIFAIPRLTICPIIADKQTYFDATLELCLWSETSPCKNPSTGTGTGPITEPTKPTSATPGSMTCKYDPIPDTPTKPKDCDPIKPCNGPIKDDCHNHYVWTGNDHTTAPCLQGQYYNVRTQQCEDTPCPPCKKE